MGLWEEGTYWHLATRQGELARITDPKLRALAPELDKKLASCTHRTILHGDAKLANFAFALANAPPSQKPFKGTAAQACAAVGHHQDPRARWSVTATRSALVVQGEVSDDDYRASGALLIQRIADVPSLPGVSAYGATREEATAKVEALGLRVIADRIEHGELVLHADGVAFVAA